MLPTQTLNVSPFGSLAPAIACPKYARPPCTGAAAAAAAGACLQRVNSMDVGMQRQVSGQLQRAASRSCRSSGRCLALGAVAEQGGFMHILSDPGAAAASFDEVCEALGDVAKLDNVTSAVTASLGAGPAVKAVLGNNAALAWLVEKFAGNLHQFTLLEGLVDKTLLDLFQQLYSVLDLDGTIFDMPAVRLAVAAAVALMVRQLVQQYRQQVPSGTLERQLSPATSLSDAIAETTAAAVIASAVGASTIAEQQQQMLPAMAGCTAAAATITSSSSDSSSSVFKQVSSSLLQAELSTFKKARVATGSLMASMVLGQFKRANKLKRKLRSTAAEVSKGRWSPAALLVGIEAAVLIHNYSELASGISTLLHIAN